jgi:hypothetical protein
MEPSTLEKSAFEEEDTQATTAVVREESKEAVRAIADTDNIEGESSVLNDGPISILKLRRSINSDVEASIFLSI